MQLVKSIVYRKLTNADFFNINKQRGTEQRGGGQSYIDMPTSAVNEKQWNRFFGFTNTGSTNNGPKWEFKIHSLGVKNTQRIIIGQRRKTTFSIRSQKLHSKNSNRVYAWHPDFTKFPTLSDASKREDIQDLVIYITALDDGEFWAGWFQSENPKANWSINSDLYKMFNAEKGGAGLIEGKGNITFDKNNDEWPFIATKKSSITKKPPVKKKTSEKKKKFKYRDEKDIINDLFEEDESTEIDDKRKTTVRKIKVRNTKAIKILKELYGGECQISGKKYAFKKKNGEYYSEGHHLIPLGEGGSDSVYNIVIVNPLMHRMLHYAKVSNIELNEIDNDELKIEINGEKYKIKWHPKHSEIVSKSMKK